VYKTWQSAPEFKLCLFWLILELSLDIIIKMISFMIERLA
jgi:hypothetical protein